MSQEQLEDAVQEGLRQTVRKPRNLADDRRCTAMSKRSHERCRNPSEWAHGSTKCRMHGSRSKRGVEAPNFIHGGRSKYFPRAELPEVIARAAKLQTPDGLQHVAAVNAAVDAHLKEQVDPTANLDGFAKLDDNERKWTETLIKAQDAERDKAPTVAPIFQIANIAAPSVILVRGPAGDSAKLLRASDLTLLECADGAWRPAESFQIIDGVTAWRPLASLPTPEESAT